MYRCVLPRGYVPQQHGGSPKRQSHLSIPRLGAGAPVSWVQPPTVGMVRLWDQKALLLTI